jgi:hypothetical protein
MAGYFDVYKKRMASKSSTSREVREQAVRSTLDRNFVLMDGYTIGTYIARSQVDDDTYQNETKEIELAMRTSTNSYERYLTFRPETEIAVGTYIKVGNETLVVRERQTIEPLPVYRAFACNQVLRLKDCPFEFPCFSYNSTYSSKGIIDIDRAYGLDSRNKIYVQKNKFSNRLLEHHRGYRIRLGDEDGYYSFYITEMDDLSYKGMYIISLKIDEVHPSDEGVYCYNEDPINFSDLIYIVGQGNPTDQVEQPVLVGESYLYIGEEYEFACSKTVNSWEYDSTCIEAISVEGQTFKCRPLRVGITTISITDKDGIEIIKNIIIKEQQ